MSGPLILLLVGAILFVALGLQVLSRQLQRFPMDVRRADPLIDVTTTKSITVRPAELHQLVGIISNSLLSDASIRTELQPLLDDLGAASPKPGKRLIRRGRGRRSQWIDQAIRDLEDRWELHQPDPDGEP